MKVSGSEESLLYLLFIVLLRFSQLTTRSIFLRVPQSLGRKQHSTISRVLFRVAC